MIREGCAVTDDDAIPTLTEVVAFESPDAALSPQALADLQADLTARVLRLAEELVHHASRDVQTVLLEQVCDRLRAQLPELVDQVLQDRLMK